MTADAYDPTASRDAEEAVLGAALQSAEAAAEVSSRLKGKDFFSTQNQLIHEAIVELSNGGKPVDEITLIDCIGRRHELERVGGASYISQLTDRVPDVANFSYYIGLVKAQATGRALAKVAEIIAKNPSDLSAQSEMEGLLHRRNEGPPRIRCIALDELFRMEIPLRKYLLKPWLREQDLVMIHARRGIGKTMIGLGISCAVGSGSKFLCWDAPEQRGVLYVDGELPADLLRERFRQQKEAFGLGDEPLIKVASHQLQKNCVLSLATPEGRDQIEQGVTNDISLVILDNLSCLYGGEENDADAWQGMQDFLLRLRRKGVACIIIHHSGKGGQQRGTSRREDILDTVITLKQPPGYKAEEGARFKVHFEKSRGLTGPIVEPFEAHLTTTEDGHPIWLAKSLHPEKDKALEFMKKGLNDSEISREMTTPNRTTLGRWRKDFKRAGLL